MAFDPKKFAGAHCGCRYQQDYRPTLGRDGKKESGTLEVIKFYYDGAIRFEQHCYGEAATFVFGVWASGMDADGTLHWAFRGGLHIGDLKAHPLQSRHAVHDGMVLKGAGDEVLLVLAGLGEGSALHGPVVGLGAAAGKEDLCRGSIDGLCHLGAAGVHKLLGFVADAVMAAGVAAGSAQGLDHNSQCFRGTGSCCGIVEINHFLADFHRKNPF